MRKFFTLFFFLTLIGCQMISPLIGSRATATAVPSITVQPQTTAAVQPSATPSPVPSPTLVHPPLSSQDRWSEDQFEVRFHPDGPLYIGDLISLEVIGPGELPLESEEVQVSLDGGESIGSAGFTGFGIGDRQQATLRWVWNTDGLTPGDFDLLFSLQPSGLSFTRTLTLLPESTLSSLESQAAWAQAESDCCLIYYVTGTAAERDLEYLLSIADQEAEKTINQFREIFVEPFAEPFVEPLEIVFLPRVLGHGGFAGDELYISYLDRNYAGNDPTQVLHHEMVHVLDARSGGDFRPSLFAEGLAVYLSGGHFKHEPIVPRAASLLESEAYLGLIELSNDFYNAQHEISYLQAAALVGYMVETWGFDAFNDFYRSIQPQESGLSSDAIEQGLLASFEIGFSELEEGYLEYLGLQPVDLIAGEDVQLSVYFFDTVRRYQQALDPSAYFLTAWLVDVDDLLENDGIVADILRHPEKPENLALETLLVSADKALREGDFEGANRYLTAVNQVLDGIENGDNQAFYRDPQALDHYALVLAALDAGLLPQTIQVQGENGRVIGWMNSWDLIELEFERQPAGWVIP